MGGPLHGNQSQARRLGFPSGPIRVSTQDGDAAPERGGDRREASGGFLEGMDSGHFSAQEAENYIVLLRGTALGKREITCMGYTDRLPGNKVTAPHLWWCPALHCSRPSWETRLNGGHPRTP